MMSVLALVAYTMLCVFLFSKIYKDAISQPKAIVHCLIEDDQQGLQAVQKARAYLRPDSDHVGLYEFFKLFVMLPVAVVRALFVFAVLFSYTRVAQVALIGYSGSDKDVLPAWRRKIVATCPLFARVLLVGLGFHKITVKGKATGKSPTLVSNHSSWVDIVANVAFSGDMPGFVSKAEVKKAPVLAPGCRAIRCIFTERTGTSKTSDLIRERQTSHADGAPPIIIYPEGTTTNGRFLAHFHSGAFLSGLPVELMVLKYPWQYFSPTYESISFPMHLLRLLCQFSNSMEVIHGGDYHPSEAERKDPHLYAANVRKKMIELSGIPGLETSLADKRTFQDVLKRVLPQKKVKNA